MIKSFINLIYVIWQKYAPDSISQSEIDQNFDRKRKLRAKTKILFSLGAGTEGAVSAAGITTVLFYNQVLGVSPGLCGLAVALSIISDAVTDPLVGTFSDKINTLVGRRHPLMFLSALPLGIGLFFLYMPLNGLSEMQLFFWLLTFMVVTKFGLTLYLVPHDGLGAELTDDYDERSSLFGYNEVGTMLFPSILVFIVYLVIFPSSDEYANGMLNQARYIILAVTMSLVAASSALICTLGTLDQIPYLHKVDVSKKFHFADFFKELKELLMNQSYLALCAWMLLMYIGLGIIGIVSTYAYIYVFELSTERMVWIGMAKMPGILLCMPILFFVTSKLKLGKKEIMSFCTAIPALLVALPHIAKYAGYWPDNDSPILVGSLVAPLLIAYCIFPLSMIVMNSALVDVADEHELKTGYRSEGVIFSVKSFAQKSTQSVGSLIAGIGLEVINFPDKAEMGNLPQEALDGLLIMNGHVYLMFWFAAAAAVYFFFSITRESQEATVKKLEEIRAQRQS